MKKKGLNYFLSILTVAIFTIASFFVSIPKQHVFATNEESLPGVDLFIRKPTYSTIYENKIYFVDEIDGLLKVYNNETDIFEQEFLSLNDYQNIKDVIFVENYMLAVVEKDLENSENNKIVLILVDLEQLEIKEIDFNGLKQEHDKIFAQKTVLENDNVFLITLTSNDCSKTNSLVLVVSLSDLTVKHECSITFDDSKQGISTIKDELLKLFVIPSENENQFNVIYFYGSKVAHNHIGIQTLKSGNANINSATNFEITLINSSQDIEISDIALIKIGEKNHFLVSYTEDGVLSYRLTFYKFNIGDGTTTEFSESYYIPSTYNGYLLTNSDYLIYTNEQSIVYVQVKYDLNENKYYMHVEPTTITNPAIDIIYYAQNNFKYLTSKITTCMLETPWDFETDKLVSIPENVDLICIGYGQLKNTNIKIVDYYYSLFTQNNINYKGYVKLDSLKEKSTVSIDDYEFSPVVTVYEGTNLYSLPTVVVDSSYITNLYQSKVLQKIDKNTRVEIIDTICEYSSNNAKLVKVKVNGVEGYINCKNICPTLDVVEYLKTNSYIKKDGTKVYSSASSNSTVKDVLNLNKGVLIEGKRDTKTGFTFIRYNDEYGNELTGYIATDYIESNSWTTMQIIGCILIAINVGLLILILIFKKNHIGKDGQRYQNSKKPNYKEQ